MSLWGIPFVLLNKKDFNFSHGRKVEEGCHMTKLLEGSDRIREASEVLGEAGSTKEFHTDPERSVRGERDAAKVAASVYGLGVVSLSAPHEIAVAVVRGVAVYVVDDREWVVLIVQEPRLSNKAMDHHLSAVYADAGVSVGGNAGHSVRSSVEDAAIGRHPKVGVCGVGERSFHV